METNRISFLDFRQQLLAFDVFSTGDILKFFPRFDARRLFEWQQKGYVVKLANRWYRFMDRPLDEETAWFIANRIYQPSYISLETALSHYGLIPEGVFSIISVTTNKTRSIETPNGNYQYRTLKPSLYFGYSVLRKNKYPVLLADVEKAVLDYLYFHPTLLTNEDFEALRLNVHAALSVVDEGKMDRYLAIFESNALNARVKIFKKYLYA